MKKTLLPALAALMVVAAPAAFARTAGSWYVVADNSTHACYAVDRTASIGEQTLSGPYRSQARATAAMDGTLACGSQWHP